MTSKVYTYDPADVSVIFDGVPMSGFAEGTFVSIASDADQWTKEVGSDGHVSRTKANNRTATMTLTLMQGSPSNDVLSGYYAADQLDNSGVVQVMVKDNSGRTRVFSEAGWIQKIPDVEFSNEESSREWTIALAQTDFSVGGNSAQPSS